MVKASHEGEVLVEVKLAGETPSNLAFGGPNARTCYVMLADRGSVEAFCTDLPGRSWELSQGRSAT